MRKSLSTITSTWQIRGDNSVWVTSKDRSNWTACILSTVSVSFVSRLEHYSRNLWLSIFYFISFQEGEDDHLRKQYSEIDQHLEETLFTEDNAGGLLQKAERKLGLGKVLDNQVLFRDIMDCLILAKFNLDFCRDSQIKLELTEKINQLQKEAHLAVKPYPDHLKMQVKYLDV